MKDNVWRKFWCQVVKSMVPGNTDILSGTVLSEAANRDQKVAAIHGIGTAIGIHRIVNRSLTTFDNSDNTRELDCLRFT